MTVRQLCLLCERSPFMGTPLCRECGRKIGAHGLPLRILSQIVEFDGHHFWTGHQLNGGYGVAMWRGRSQPVHRIVYQATHSVELAYSQQLDHLCRRRLCCDPSHLEVVDNRENAVRGAASLLGAKTSRMLGVSYDKARGRWRAQAKVAGRPVYLGRFRTEAEAASAYDAAVRDVAISTNASLGLLAEDVA